MDVYIPENTPTPPTTAAYLLPLLSLATEYHSDGDGADVFIQVLPPSSDSDDGGKF